MIKKIKNFKKHTIISSLNAIDAIKKLNKSDNRFLLVVNENKKVLGSITDGDVRRWLISGGAPKDTASSIMNDSPLIGNKEDEDNNLYKLRKIPFYYVKFLPILDKHEKLCEILISDEQIINNSFTALIMAGGFGKRLGKITKNIPKPMLKIGNKSILEMTIDKLENDGCKNIYISVHHMGDKIERFVNKRNNLAKIEILNEKKPLGTIGALGLINDEIDWPLLIINSDLVTDLKFKSIIDFHNSNKNDMSVVTSTYKNEIPFGIIESNKTGLIKYVNEKPIYNYPILAGVYCVNKNIKQFVQYYKPKDATDLINEVINNNKRVQMFPMYEYWKDIGRPVDFNEVKNNIDSSIEISGILRR